jgi:hypothetical protein
VLRHRGPEDTQVLEGGGQERMLTDRDLYGVDTWPGGIEPSAIPAGWGPERTNVSSWSGFGLILSVIGLCATLTGLLAAEGAAVAALGFLIAIGGLVDSRRPGVNGRGVAGLAMFIAITAVALAVLALSGRYSWPNSRTNEITAAHAWLVGHWARLGRW